MMANGLILLVQLGLLALLVLLAVKMISLMRAEPLAAGHQEDWAGKHPGTHQSEPASRHSEWPVAVRQPVVDAAPDRAELITQLLILAGLQERDCRVNGVDLSTAPNAVKTYAAVWLYGAGCALSDKTNRHSSALAATVAQIASRKTGIRQSEIVEAIDTLTASTVYLACFRAGLEGAEFWRFNHYVPPTSSLYEAITANAFI